MTNTSDRLEKAVIQWRGLLGSDYVITDDKLVRKYSRCTINSERKIPAVLLPENSTQVADVAKIAHQYRIPLYPISTGHNWGYGSANPVVDDCVIVDLSRMDRIEIDTELGLATLEPGVTQEKLHNYLTERNLPFMVPVTGAGPACSLVGNALERGYGITPYTDHFAAVTALKAILPDGSTYQSALSELGGTLVDQAYKWGLGPYLDGLFAQGNFGIVTEMTIALARKPAHITSFFFSVSRDEGLEGAVGAIRECLACTEGITGSINLMNSRRVLSMLAPYPDFDRAQSTTIPSNTLSELAKQHQIMPWTGVGAIYGEKPLAKAAKSIIKAKLRGKVSRLIFIRPSTIQRVQRFGECSRYLQKSRLALMAKRLSATLDIMQGKPSEVALPLAYWKANIEQPGGIELDPARDGCGLIWYAPLVPIKKDKVRLFVEMVKDICIAHGMEPLITLTSLSSRCFDSTVPLLFDRNNPDEAARAQQCYFALWEAGRKEGFIPYRMGIHSMRLVTQQKSPYWNMVNTLKTALDPDHIISPGRYSPLPEKSNGE